jgi:hypothetical protein
MVHAVRNSYVPGDISKIAVAGNHIIIRVIEKLTIKARNLRLVQALERC